LPSYPVPERAGEAGAGRTADGVDPEGPRPNATEGARRPVVVLDPGHGRGDPGAVHYLPDGRVGITEAGSNLRNAELIRERLLTMGYDVYLTREGAGQGPGAPLPLQFIASDLYARVGLAKAVEADVYLAIHGNGASVKSISGPETWYCGQHREGAANERLATLVQRAMMNALLEYGYTPPDRGIKEDAESHHSGGFCQFVVTREAEVPAALLEFLFLSNADDGRVLMDDRSHVLLAGHVAAAIDEFMRERWASR
jgi:N-acetylmuramoyl-L-alanine amidase